MVPRRIGLVGPARRVPCLQPELQKNAIPHTPSFGANCPKSERERVVLHHDDPESPTPFFVHLSIHPSSPCICAAVGPEKSRSFCCHWFHILISWVLGNVGAAALMVLSDFPFGLTVVMKKPKKTCFSSLLLSCTSFVPSLVLRNICHMSWCSRSSAGLLGAKNQFQNLYVLVSGQK